VDHQELHAGSAQIDLEVMAKLGEAGERPNGGAPEDGRRAQQIGSHHDRSKPVPDLVEVVTSRPVRTCSANCKSLPTGDFFLNSAGARLVRGLNFKARWQ
jgi:hypothetical protein